MVRKRKEKSDLKANPLPTINAFSFFEPPTIPIPLTISISYFSNLPYYSTP